MVQSQSMIYNYKDEDEVRVELGSSDDTSSDKLQLMTTTRSGRVVGSWKNAFL